MICLKFRYFQLSSMVVTKTINQSNNTFFQSISHSINQSLTQTSCHTIRLQVSKQSNNQRKRRRQSRTSFAPTKNQAIHLTTLSLTSKQSITQSINLFMSQSISLCSPNLDQICTQTIKQSKTLSLLPKLDPTRSPPIKRSHNL